ncbi:MAG: SLAC1 anion channel family protein [Candidatus Competibacteraceae bacterium]
MPISFFAVVMGLAGWAIAWEKTEEIFALPLQPSVYLLGFAALVFALLVVAYTVKLVRHSKFVIAELRHPVKLNFFPTLSISLVLLAIGTQHSAPTVSQGLWIAGATAHLAFTLFVLGTWIDQTVFEIQHLNPAWFIPVVGNILIPIAGVDHASPGNFLVLLQHRAGFWIVLFTVIVYRVIFHHPIPERLVPTLFILVAPPAVGFLAYVRLNEGLDHFARILFYCALFLTLLLATQLSKFTRLRFFLSWWAYSFPLAAMTIATEVMYGQTGAVGFKYLAIVLLAILSIIVIGLTVRTGLAIVRARSALKKAESRQTVR